MLNPILHVGPIHHSIHKPYTLEAYENTYTLECNVYEFKICVTYVSFVETIRNSNEEDRIA